MQQLADMRPEVVDLHGAPIAWVLVASSNVAAVLWRYEGASTAGNVGALYVQFRSGAVYQYDGVTRAVYDGLVAAPSVGSYVARVLKGQYPTTRVPVPQGAEQPEEGRGPGETGSFVRRMVQPEDDPNYSHGGGGGVFGRNAGWE